MDAELAPDTFAGSAFPPPIDDETGAQHTPAAIIERAVDAAREMLEMDVAYVADVREELRDASAVAGDGSSFGIAADSPIPLAGTYCEMVLCGTLDNIVHDAASDPRVAGLQVTADAQIGSYIGVPVDLGDGRTYGMFCCLSHDARPDLGARDVRFMQVLARLVGDQLHREEIAAAERQRELTSHSTRALLAALAARDGYTEAHSEAVLGLAVSVGAELGLSAGALQDLESAALLHDIGKIGVRDAILSKPGKLTDAEWTEMRRHPMVGAEMVAGMPALAHLAAVIRAEHERFDGNGYPDGLGGEQIPLASRIVLVCDAYHAMTSDRPYRTSLGKRAALRELNENAGTQFCPQCVAAITKLLGRVQ